MQDAKEDVRARLAIEDVIGEYVQLKRAGRNFKGLSPFSQEKTPSFYVSPDKNIWHDFSSNKGGDIFSFVMEVEGLDFRATLELLARKAGIELDAYDSKGSQDRAKLKRRLLEANELAARFYQQSLLKNERALTYVFSQRGINKDMVQSFRLGYAPDSNDALTSLLKKRGFSPKELSLAGLTNRRGGDLFRARMMVPLMDQSGQVIGFTGRIIGDVPNAPKYLNTPQTLIYDKGRHVFGLSQAKEAIRTSEHAVVVEGNLDVVSSHQAGVRQTVATAGTALTEAHLKALSRLSENVRLAFDADAAGLAATERAIPIAQRVGVELTIVSLPEGVKDPDELIQKEPSSWQKAIDSATPVVDWLFSQYSAREDMSTARGKRQFTTVALTVVRNLKDSVEQEHYLKQIADMTDVSLAAIQDKFAQTEGEIEAPRKKVMRASEPPVQDAHVYQDNLLALALIDEASRTALDELQPDMLVGEVRREVLLRVKTLKGVVNETPKGLQDYDTYVRILLLKADTRYGQWSESDRLLEMARLIRLAITEHNQTQKETLTAELRIAEDEGDDTRADTLRKELNELIKETPHAKR